MNHFLIIKIVILLFVKCKLHQVHYFFVSFLEPKTIQHPLKDSIILKGFLRSILWRFSKVQFSKENFYRSKQFFRLKKLFINFWESMQLRYKYLHFRLFFKWHEWCLLYKFIYSKFKFFELTEVFNRTMKLS